MTGFLQEPTKNVRILTRSDEKMLGFLPDQQYWLVVIIYYTSVGLTFALNNVQQKLYQLFRHA